MSTGKWNELRQRTTSNAHLDKLGKKHNLQTSIHGNPQNPQQISPNMVAATVEAITSAAYVDGGLPAARVVIEHFGLLGVGEMLRGNAEKLWTSKSRLGSV